MESLSQTLSSTGSAGPVARDMIRRAERFYSDKTAVVCGNERWTYRQFGIRVRKVAGALTSLGVNKGDRVALLMLNCHRYLELFACTGYLAHLFGKGHRKSERAYLHLLQIDVQPGKI
jgi:non-ribosomal peptide synthetase component E (peptide arylation enzyme)